MLTKVLLKCAMKMAKLKNRLKFLLNCRKCKLVPRCLDFRMKIQVHNDASYRELKKLEHMQKIRLISVIISYTKRSMEKCKKEKRYVSEKLSTILDDSEWHRIKNQIEGKVSKVYNLTKAKETRKLNNMKISKIRETNRQSE